MTHRKTQSEGTGGTSSGTLIIIGGHEDKEGKRTILKEVARKVGSGRLVIASVASHEPEGYFENYQQVFAELGVTDTSDLYIEERSQAAQEDHLRLFDGATGVFFTGGDQLRITSQIGDTPIEQRVQEIYAAGGVVCGTSAGASAMCETMLVKGRGSESYRVGGLRMAPGLGLIRSVIIDQHFAERGRMGRLLGAVAQNPRLLGIGIDEDTAIVVQDEGFTVLGSGAVYVVDGAGITHSNIADARTEAVLSMYDVRVHVLGDGEGFDLGSRRPTGARELRESQHLEDASKAGRGAPSETVSSE